MRDERRIEWVHTYEVPKKSADWYWVVGIMATAMIIVAIFLDNLLFAVVIGLAAIALALAARRTKSETPCQISERGISIGEDHHPYHTLESFHVDRTLSEGPVLRIKSERVLTPLLTVPVPEEYADGIEELLIVYLPTEHIEVPIAHRISDIIGL